MTSWQRFLRDSVPGDSLSPSPNPLRLNAKTFAVHKNGLFYGRSLQKSTVHEKGCFCGWDVKMSELRLK